MIRAAALLAAACATAQAESWSYRVELDPATPLAARVTVELPAERRAQDFSVQVRGRAVGLTPQIADLRCDGAPLAPDSASAWRVQGWNCVRLSWTVPLRSAGDGVDLRQRESFFDAPAGVWLFSEASSLLRPVGDTPHDGEIEFAGGGPVHGGAPAAEPRRRLVPDRGQPFEFYAIGERPVATLRQGAIEAVHVDAFGVDWRALLAEQRRALRYLTRTAGRALPPARSTIVWFAAPAEEGGAIGTAGHRTLLLSATARDGRAPPTEVVLAWLLREQLLQALPERMPPWARESIAQYYALKALRRTEIAPAAVAAVERRIIDPLRAPTGTLRATQRRCAGGDRSARDELFTAGAAFWDRLDRAIVRKSGFRTLDSVLPRLLAVEWTDERLPGEIVELLHRYAGESAVDELLAQYVGQ